MRRLGAWVAIATLALAAWTVSPEAALAKTDVAVTDVKLPGDHASKELERSVRAAVAHAAKAARFGHAKHVELSVSLVELSVEEADGIVHVTCTLTGKLKGGGVARSHVSFGDKPEKKKALVKQALRMAAESVVTRLADVVRDREAEEKKKDGGEKGKRDKGHEKGGHERDRRESGDRRKEKKSVSARAAG